ncbi:MAG: beta-galactosidase [Candidatus Hydrogenedentes bacterium]|nr:beta-galactosidase [Candidatus Hydrogenedentota bacterium]
MSRVMPPYLGAAYYPEAWPAEQVDEDIRLMLDAGLNVARIGEFAWSSMEPEEDRYAFDWLHRVVDKLGEAGIATIMGTPTATPPAWLSERYPEILAVGPDGVRAQHGARRHVCPNSPVYRDHCARIVTRLALEFGRDENVIGWQIDNEVHPWQGRGCYCEVCVAEFRERLRCKFDTIDDLNAAWGMALWSQAYQSFAQVPAPRPDIWHHPSLLTEWALFHSESQIQYVAHQAEILRRSVSQPIGTDMMPTLACDYREMHRALDLVQYNHYDGMDTLWRQVFWMDYVRPLKDRPFWNTETATCWNGSTAANGYKEPGFCRVNSWLPVALGGEANLYWLWRAHWSGQELMHGSVVSSCGRPLHMIDEVREIGAGFRQCAEFLNGTRPVRPEVAVHFSHFAWWLFRFQPMINKFDYPEALMGRFYRPLMDAQLRADVIDPAADLEAYRLVCSPFLPALDEGGLSERLYAWIEAGGTWIVGPLADVRTLDATKYIHAPFGRLEDWAGVRCAGQIPGDPRDFALRWAHGAESTGSLWYDGLEPAGAATALATYADGPFEGLAAATETPVGDGRIVLLGTLPGPDDLGRLLLKCADASGIAPAEASANVLLVPRMGQAGVGFVALERENRPGTLKLTRPATDLLTGRQCRGEIAVSPYEVLVLQE